MPATLTARLVADLATLVSCESPSDDLRATTECAGLAAQIGEAWLGEKAEQVRFSDRVHVRWRFGQASRVLLLGHLDTVWPVGTLARWPFDVTGDRATGPGVFDMKAGVVQLLAAASQLDHLDGVTILLTCDEEIGSPAGRAVIAEAIRDAAAVLVFEPSADGALKTARKGVAQFRLRVSGRAAHAGLEPERGVNASVEAAHQVLAIADLSAPELGTTVTPTVLNAGTAVNVVPESATIAVDVRAATISEQDRVRAALASLRPVLAGATLTSEPGMSVPPLEAGASERLFSLARATAAELDLPALRGTAVGGGSDGNFTAAAGVPTLDGLGAVGGNAHAEGEWIAVPAMSERAALAAGLIRRILRQP
ncbi:MAG TPA: M20 family metallopeptidase [Streptosporangiaceae bacterium]|jgi:glutamate carboxypeptidase